MLYIRHGEKAYDNGGSNMFPLDPPLTDNGKKEAEIKFAQLLVIYGCPKFIVCSPYLRTRETALIAAAVLLEKKKIKVPIFCDKYIGEYLGNQRTIQGDSFRQETLCYDPILVETKPQFRLRVEEHNTRSQSGVWYITHGYFIQIVTSLKGKKIKHPNLLCGVAIIDSTITLI